MGDGMSGLSLSEMGIAVKKAGKVVQKAGTGVVQQVVQQTTGQTPNQIPSSKPEPVFETDDSGNPLSFFKTAAKQVAPSNQQNPQQQQSQKQDLTYATDDKGDPISLFQGAATQITGSGNSQKQPAQQGTFVMPKPFGDAQGKSTSSVPPSETSPKQAGGFDLASLLGEQGSLEKTLGGNQGVSQPNMALEQDLAKQQAENQQKIEKLRKQLHQIYYEEFVKKSEGKDQKKEESVQEKLEREEQEKKQKEMKELEEKKKKEQVPMGVKGRQGAHEGLKKQG